MYVIRRVWETKPREARRAASIIAEAGPGENLASSSDQQRGFALVDCREQDEYDICRIEGARLIPLSTFVFEAEKKIPDKNLPVIVYCHHGMRSSQAVTFLRKKGYPKAFSMSGGIEAWSEEIDPSVPKY